MSRILVVDDSRIARMGMRRILEKAGHEVVEADSGEAGLGLLQSQGSTIDCVTVDVLMPGMGGIEFLQESRARGYGVQVIVCTADIQKSTRDECHQKGAWGVVSKPVDSDELLALIASSAAQRDKLALSEEQRDWLTELVNMGVGRAAAALNDLVEGHVELRVPYVDLVHPQQLSDAVGVLSHTPVSSV